MLCEIGLKQPTGYHFKLPEHDINDMVVTVLEKVKKENDEICRKLRELFLNKFNTYKNGKNKQP